MKLLNVGSGVFCAKVFLALRSFVVKSSLGTVVCVSACLRSLLRSLLSAPQVSELIQSVSSRVGNNAAFVVCVSRRVKETVISDFDYDFDCSFDTDHSSRSALSLSSLRVLYR